MLGPSLFNEVEPPQVWVELGTQPIGPIDDTRTLKIRIKPVGAASLTATFEASRYAPEWSVMAALGEFFRQLETMQQTPTRGTFQTLFTAVCSRRVEPF